MTDLDQLHEQAMERICAEMDARLLRDGLQMIDRMSRRGLLVAIGWDGCKDNTERLRRKARLAFIGGSASFDLWAGYHA